MAAPAYPSLALFKALLLQQWYGLSDPGLEEALSDRLSFRRFIGFGPERAGAGSFDAVAFSRATGRKRAGRKGLCADITSQIERSGFVLKRGTLIDASLVRSAVNLRLRRPSHPLPPDADGRPASKLVKSSLDPDAGWTVKQENKRFFGYKAHIAMDQGSRIIRAGLVHPCKRQRERARRRIHPRRTKRPSMPTKPMIKMQGGHG